jgi:hypothetical protein
LLLVKPHKHLNRHGADSDGLLSLDRRTISSIYDSFTLH